MPGWTRNAHGRAPAALLDAVPALERAARARLPAEEGAPARRGPGRVSRHAGRGRAAGGQLPAPRRVALLRPQRGMRAPLLVSRLEVRRHRPLRGHAERAGGEHLQGQGPRPRLSVPRRERRDLDLHGAARDGAAVPGLRDQHAAGRPGLPAAHDAGGVQLGAGARGRHRLLPHRLRARQAHARHASSAARFTGTSGRGSRCCPRTTARATRPGGARTSRASTGTASPSSSCRSTR